MFSLGIPTTRAASLVVSETRVKRDKLFSGNEEFERCAVVLRAAPHFFRFGSFEIFKDYDKSTEKAGPSAGLKTEMLPKLLDYLWDNFYSKKMANIDTRGRKDKRYKLIFK
jgi:uncharacterized protein YdiU (UPF0061 family)